MDGMVGVLVLHLGPARRRSFQGKQFVRGGRVYDRVASA
jgi:hypothetical protein